ncbi:hypothetical protein COU57_01790 [Candidatus Pacearchaeota archaeon CG10_big_fil_rev_8_21_14_0_10_32_14]|nr:MAG: hypothetical protein COU57_01790 [Candidatus Pacearchaeota archaeon CG10_big_fil_rev_8_21_14_0_10_32_14]
MKLNSIPTFANKNVEESFLLLENGDLSDKQLFKFINQALTNIEENVFCGVQIPKRLIPKEYEVKYGIKNLWKYDLPKGWRLMYSIVNEEAIIISLVLEWLDHKEYERRFHY